MGRRSGALSKLGMKRVPTKIWENGHYRYRDPIGETDTGDLIFLCESKDGVKQWNETQKIPTLSDMGLRRVGPKGKVELIPPAPAYRRPPQ